MLIRLFISYNFPSGPSKEQRESGKASAQTTRIKFHETMGKKLVFVKPGFNCIKRKTKLPNFQDEVGVVRVF